MAVGTSQVARFVLDHAFAVGSFAVVSLIFVFSCRRSRRHEPPSLADAIPFISNTYQYMTDLQSFTKRASHALSRTDVVKFYIGPMRVYFVKGGESVQAMFRLSNVLSSDKFILMVLKNLQGASEEDIAKFVNDKSGRLKTPAPGWENVPQERRYWYTLHHVAITNLTQSEPANHLTKMFGRFFDAALEKQPLGQWSTIRLFDLLRRDMGESALKAMSGTKVLEMHPGYIEQFWRFDSVAFQLVYGLPRWMNRKPVEERDKLNRMTREYLKRAFTNFDWNGPDAAAAWEPTFGSTYTRRIAKWLYDMDMSEQMRAGCYMVGVFGVNSNTIPVTTWAMMEVLKDPSLFQDLRSEALHALNADPLSGKRFFDVAKLTSLPLLQSVYVECMRLHVSINVTREIIQATILHGYRLEKGALLQAPTNIAHQDEKTWAHDGHEASKFWAERHVKSVKMVTNDKGQVTTEKQFVLAGKANEFFPYGGGVSMCPGRHFAKQEILLTIALLVTRFDIQFVDWVHMDGSKSERPPMDDQRYFGSAAVPPDRDVKLRWKRLW
ncbi:Cholesterol 7-alpha-monooxygenase 2 [Colletotrichum chlorophyti]|uniref:Cholesterol 7-alpha-monooxygenase 2 n=1 Tax=Colletotrichum chlorophyti TaxID=708187 RepID=A0A1Q8S676_9PEZI|nr:Cholesterol 7-alpha-monooxygenase 2 [Colletotrichum chlorophyti]